MASLSQRIQQNSQADQQRVAAITNFIATDPQIQQWRAQAAARNEQFEGPAAKQQIEDYLASKGMSLPDGYVIQQNGTPVKDAGFDWKPVIGMGALVTGGLLGPALLGGGAAAGAGGGGATAALGPTTAGTIAGTAAGAAAPASIAAGGGAAAGTVGAAAAGTSLWKTLAAPAIGAGTQIAGSLIQANQQGKATDAQLQAAREAEAFLKQKYQQTQNQVAPYIGMGQGALAALGNGLGVRAPNPAVLTAGQSLPMGTTVSGRAPVQAPGGNQPIQPMTSDPSSQPSMPQAAGPGPNQTASGVQMVRLQSPDGSETQSVPSSQAQYFISHGAKVVG